MTEKLALVSLRSQRVRDSAMFVLLFVGSYKYGLRVPTSRIKFVRCFVKIGQQVQKLTCRDTHKHAAFVLSPAGMKYDSEITYILTEWRWAPFVLFTDYTARKFHLCRAVLCHRQFTVCLASLAVPYALYFSRKQRNISTNARWFSHIICYICPILIKFVSFRQLPTALSKDCHENPSLEAEVFQTDRHDEVSSHCS